MSVKTYRLLMRIIVVVLAGIIAASVVMELPLYVPLIGIMISLVVVSVCRHFLKDIMSDERSRRIEEKATDMSYRIYTIIAAIFALVVLMLKNILPSWMGIAGETLAYSVCGLMLVHLVTVAYYQRRL